MKKKKVLPNKGKADDIIDFSKVDKPMSKKEKDKFMVGKNKKNSKSK